jgi:hypothetical protein
MLMTTGRMLVFAMFHEWDATADSLLQGEAHHGPSILCVPSGETTVMTTGFFEMFPSLVQAENIGVWRT